MANVLFAIVAVIIFGFSNAVNLPLNPIIITANYDQNYSFSLNSTIEYVFVYSEQGVSI